MATEFPKFWSAVQNGYGQQGSGQGNVGSLVLNFVGIPTTDDSFTFTGTCDVPGQTGTISGSYDGVAKMITFVRVPQGASFTQTFTGFLGDGDPNSLTFGGSLTATNYPGTDLRTHFGWFAVQTPLIP